MLTVVRITPWELQKKILFCAEILSSTPFLCCANPLFPGVTGFFVLEFTYMIMQAFVVCELTHTGWKKIPGSVCILPQFVSITLVVSELSPSFVTLPVCSPVWFSVTVISDAILVATPLMVCQISRFSRRPGLFLIDELRSLGVFTYGRYASVYFLSSPCRPQQHWWL